MSLAVLKNVELDTQKKIAKDVLNAFIKCAVDEARMLQLQLLY